MDQKISNPFTESRVSFPTSSSLLTYGDDSFTFFSRLKNGNKLYQFHAANTTQKKAEQRIVSKYQKQLYSMDQSGHCLAESVLDQMITQDQTKQQNFWQKIIKIKPQKQIQNPFSSRNQFLYQSNTRTTSFKSAVSKITFSEQRDNIKTKRHSARLQMKKIKDIIKKKELNQEKKQGKTQKFSLVNMYKIKRENSLGVNTAITFGIHSQPKIESQKIKEAFPQSINVKGLSYFLIPLQN